MAQSAPAETGVSPDVSDEAGAGRFVGNFAEVEVGLNDAVSFSDISSVTKAPGGKVEVLDGGKSVRVQLPAESVEALIEQGAEITVLRKFTLVEGGISQGSTMASDLAPLAVCSGSYIDGDSPLDVYIETPWPMYYGSGLDFSVAPAHIVSCIDVHYQVADLSWVSIVDVELSDEDYMSYTFPLVSGWYGLDGDIVQTKVGITAFNGEALNQAWYVWATDLYPDGWGHIDYWWIKLYYESPGEYCSASGANYSYEHVSRVQVGDIDNATGASSYTDYTHLCTVMETETGYPITVTNGYPYDQYDYCGVWVDWNQDKTFDDAPPEKISVIPGQMQGAGVLTFVGTVTPPAGAALGNTRMRVRMLWNDPIEPCGTTTYGEVEDYTIKVRGVPGDLITPSGVDMRDYAVLAGQWQKAPGEPSADLTPGCGDGVVNWFDLDVLVENWLAGVGP
jgi:hypothetical protein